MLNIKQIIAKCEDAQLEVKKAAGGIPESLWESYSAFANTNGGVILLGVEERNKKFVISGVDNAQQKIKNIWDTLNNRKKISENILMEKHIYIQSVEDKDVIVIEVQRADRHDKPVYINNDVLGSTFRRNFEGDYRCSKQSVKAMLRDQSDLPIDGAVFDELTWEDLDKDSIRRYRNRFASLKPAHIWNGLDTVEFLKKVGAVRRNEKSFFSPTLAGLVMFGTEDVITQILPDYFLDFREIFDKNRWSDRVVSNLGEWSGNIFDFFFRIAEKLTAEVKRPFRMRNNLEREDDTAIHKALREALANALIHADYYGRQGIVIEKRRNEIRISNPGTCRPPIFEIIEGGVSDPRNPTIFKLFAMIDIGERAGSGFNTICTIWEEIGWLTPTLIEKYDPERTITTIPVEYEVKDDINDNQEKETDNIVEEINANTEESREKTEKSREKTEKGREKIEKGREKTEKGREKTEKSREKIEKGREKIEKGREKTEKSREKNIEKGREKIIELIKSNKYITQIEIADSTGLSIKGVEKNIRQLKTKGLLERIGPDKGGYWKINIKNSQ